MGTDVRTRRSRWRVVGLGVGAPALILAGVIAWVAWPAPAWRPPTPPSPNGYDDLLRAARLALEKAPTLDTVRTREADQAALRAMVEPNAEALALICEGLGRASLVPIPESIAQMQPALDRLGELRRAGRLLEADGRLAEKDGKTDQAIRSYLDLVRLGQAAGRGGLMNDVQVEVVLESLGLSGLRRLGAASAAERCRRIARELESIDRGREATRAILDRQAGFMENNVRAFGPLGQFSFTVSGLYRKEKQRADESILNAVNDGQVRIRLLAAALALRAYRADHGADPDRLADLVPDYLAAVPLDPHGQGALR